jgi:energy-coupling factor transport system ATP-binding protein
MDGLDLRVGAGEWLAVMGASDAGKTTLCLMLAGLAPHLTGGRMEGRIIVAGRDTHDHPPPALAATVGLLFQEPEAQLFNPTVEAEVAWGLENLGLPAGEIDRRVSEMLARFRLEDARRRAPGDLSGGEKKRLALASVLALRPDVLILDEPMGGLDPAGRDEALAALSQLRQDRSTTIVMTESDPEAVAAFANRVVVLHQGRIALEAPPRELFGQAEQLTALGVAVPQMAQVAAGLNRRLGTGFDFLTVDEARGALASLVGGGESRGPDTISPLPPKGGGLGWGGDCALRISDLWFGYDDEAPVLRGIDLCIPRGQFVALVGANGSGKTTLIKHFNGLLRPRRGKVHMRGQNTAGRSVGELARQVGFLFQHPEQQIFSATVRQEVSFGPRNMGLSRAQVEARVEAALTRFDLSAAAERPPAILSYGLRRRVTLASLAAMDPPILVLDEPSVGLDACSLHETFNWLAELHAQDRTVLVVTHDMTLAAERADRIIVLHAGEIIGDGAPADVFSQPDLLACTSLAPPPVVSLTQALWPDAPPNGCLTIKAFCDRYISWIKDSA